LQINVCNMGIITGLDDFRYSIMASGDVDQSDRAGRAMSAFQRRLFPCYLGPVFPVDCVFSCVFFDETGKAPYTWIYRLELPPVIESS